MSARRRDVNVAVVVAVALCLIGRAGTDAATTATPRPPVRSVPRTQVKWLINTGNLAGRWSPLAAARTDYNDDDDNNHNENDDINKNGDDDDDDNNKNDDGGDNNNNNDDTTPRCRPPVAAVASPNSISRMQMIHGGDTAVLVMPTAGDGAYRCCGDGVTSPFSLGSVRLDHGRNNLYPVIRPFPDWRAFVDDDGDDDDGVVADEKNGCSGQTSDGDAAAVDDAEGPRRDPTTTTTTTTTTSTDRRSDTTRGGDGRRDRRRKIFNAVDAFLDDRGRILWVLDTGIAGADACYGNRSPVQKHASDGADEDPPPKFLAIDVQTNQIISVVSLSRVWKPGISCFQYITAVYPDAVTNDARHSGVNETVGRDSTGTASCADWPLVVVGDAGTNHLLVYLHSKDKFTEIMLPLDDEHVFYDKNDDGQSRNDCETEGNVRKDGESKETPRLRKRWLTPPIRDILYIVPLYPQNGHSRLLITYHSCQHVYNLRLHPSTVDFSYLGDDDDNNTNDTDVTPAHPALVTGTLTILGKKPCKMAILGTDRRRTDISGADDMAFLGGGTTVYFRLENTNDIWSWNTAEKRKCSGGVGFYIDERDFQLVRVGQTCRVPVAVSAGPVVAASEDNNYNNDDSKQPTTIKTQQVVRQLIWMLETNFVDHFTGTADRMGANAKLQPIEEPLYGIMIKHNDAMTSNSGDTMERPPPLRVQPAIDNQINTTVWPSTRCFQCKR